MSIFIFPVFMAFLWSNVFIAAGAVLQRRNPRIFCMYLLSFSFVSVLSIARLFAPIELSYTRVIPSEVILPKLMELLDMPLLISGHFTVYVYTIFVFVWIIGIIVYWGEIALRYIRFQSFRKYMPCEQEAADNRAYRLMSEIIERSKSNAKVKVIQTPYVDTPMLTGFFKPAIYLPDIQFTDTELEYILRHEWTHYIDKDLWTKLLFNIICSVCWWNPLIYILKRDANHLLELKSDLSLAKQLTQESRTQYLEAMLKIAKHLSRKKYVQTLSSVGVSFVSSNNGRKIKQRFQLVNCCKPLSMPQKLGNLCACVLMLLIFAFSFLFVVQPATAHPPDFFEAGMFTINEDTAYLIDNQDGSYSLYSDGIYIFDIHDITAEPFSSFPVK